MLTKLPLARFDKDGALNKEAASALDLSPSQAGSLNASLQQALAGYRALQLARIEKEDGPADSPNGDRTLTIKVPPLPQDGAVFAQQFETALQSELGAERAELLIKANSNWIESQFGQGGASTSACSYSLTLHTNGLATFSTSDGYVSGSSSGTQSSIQQSMPSFLVPAFGDLLQPSASASSQDPAQ
jgi:hypothetical protein